MGVRGSEAGEDQGLTWVEEESGSFREAQEAFAREEYELALKILDNEVDPVMLGDQTAYRYYRAASLYGLGEKGPALKVLRSHQPESFSSAFTDYLFLKGQLTFESRSYSEAAETFDTYIRHASAPAKQQLAYYLLGISRREQGQKEAGLQALEKAVEIDADAEITALARKLLL
jgi:tetratricopeptide (TPR) repeat protein